MQVKKKLQDASRKNIFPPLEKEGKCGFFVNET
jgi:hypothetical protein